MNDLLYNDALTITDYAISGVLPEKAVFNVLKHHKKINGKTYMIAIGKAAYTMGKATCETIKIDKGLIITKYNHAKGNINNVEIIEAGHPLLDQNSVKAGKKAIELVDELNEDDELIFLISGGGSALFEDPLIPIEELSDINNQLLKSGANINEINIIRKRLSNVKGGKFAKHCKNAKIFNIILSDVIGDPLDVIASGPTINDSSTSKDALDIANKYQLRLSKKAQELLKVDGINDINNVETHIVLNNQTLIEAAKQKAQELGYETYIHGKPLTSNIDEAIIEIEKAIKNNSSSKNIALLFGGEITIKVTGTGLGGRNQELALRLKKSLNKNMCAFACGSDGTDGPTDAAGGYVDCDSNNDIDSYLNNNDSYHYFEKYGGHIKTGPTGTNVCDLYCILIKKDS